MTNSLKSKALNMTTMTSLSIWSRCWHKKWSESIMPQAVSI